jgi:hypothetical protein
MCDLNREFELEIWRDSIEFGKINKGTLSFQIFQRITKK